jgi:hypothetical protein
VLDDECVEGPAELADAFLGVVAPDAACDEDWCRILSVT